MQMKRALVMAIFTSLIAPLSMAQVGVAEGDLDHGQPRWQEVSILGGVFIDDTKHFNLTGSYAVGLRKHFGLEFEASSSFPPNGNITTLSSNINMPFATRDKKFLGFVAGGAGVTRSSADLGDRQLALQDQGIDIDTIHWDLTFDIGLGGEIYMTEGLYWRFDYRAFMLVLNDNKDTDNYQRFTVGLAARF